MTRPRTRRLHADWPRFLLHWMVAASVLVAASTGLRMAADHLDALRTGTIFTLVSFCLPQGPVFDWHVRNGLVLLALLLIYPLLAGLPEGLRRSRLGQGLRREARERQGQASSSPTQQSPTQQNRAHERPGGPARRPEVAARLGDLLHWVLTLLVCTLALSGLLQIFEWPAQAIPALTRLHGLVACALALTVLMHVAVYLLEGGLPRLGAMLWPRSARLGRALLALGLVASVGLGLNLVEGHLVQTLEVPEVRFSTFRLDGVADEPLWAVAPERVVIARRGGEADAARAVPMHVQAAHDGQRIFVRVSWPDPVPNLKHLPLVRGDQGWYVLHDGYAVSDERTWYEDKLALVWSAPETGLTASMRAAVHLGPTALGVPSAPHGRGAHASATLLDLWHWKAVRTDIMDLAEDESIHLPLPCSACDVSYSGGIRPDPKISGGYAWNWDYFTPNGGPDGNPNGVTPRRLPLSANLAGTFDEHANDGLPQTYGSMRWLESTPWRAPLDTYPPGTAIPSWLRLGDYEGDIAHVAAKGAWRDGVWTVEFSRLLDTGSAFDVRIATGSLLWLAPFDHAQARHGYHLRPLRLALGEQRVLTVE